ncbi:hypothetical protein [Xenophilus azovorans]|uniref:hypothetical protein n=1 Tax=Xenophilus azovorans TaxID=151755 RepID=UPI0012ECFF13|nr:hypothetical protein [Xenophilus azovorans]
MSKLLCECGYVIRDHELGLDYKARLISDKDIVEFFAWIANETQEYVTAVQAGEVKKWLIEKGYGEDYANLGLDHGNILHDHLYGKFLDMKKDVYECLQCGRLHIERKNNTFLSFSPPNKLFNGLFKGAQP